MVFSSCSTMCTTTKAGSCLYGCPLIPVQLCASQHHWWSGLSLHVLFFRGQITLQSQESYVSGKFLAFCLGGRGRAAVCEASQWMERQAGFGSASAFSQGHPYILCSLIYPIISLWGNETTPFFFLEVFCAVCTPLVRSRLSWTALAAWDEMAAVLLQRRKKHKHEQ